MKMTLTFLMLFIGSIGLQAQSQPISESPCSMSCRIPGLSATQCGNELHQSHDSWNVCSNYGEVWDPVHAQYTVVVGQGTCNIAWSNGGNLPNTQFSMTCAYGNCEGSGSMVCGGVSYPVNLSCSGGPLGNQSDVARMTIDRELMDCNGFGNGMTARCNNGNYTFVLWD